MEESIKIKELEEKVQFLENVLSLLPGHVYWLDKNNEYLGCNNLLAKHLGFTSGHEIVGKKNSDLLLHEHHAALLDDINQNILETGIAYAGEESGNMLYGDAIFLTHKVPLKNSNNEIQGLVGVSFDITDRKRMERDLHIAREKAELADQTKTEFIRNLEHDIRTPLCGIKSVTKYLEIVEQDPEKHTFLSDIEVASNELLHYLDNIVEFSQINTGIAPIITKEFNLEQVIRGILNLELAAARSKNIEIVYEYSKLAPTLVIGDRFRLHRMLLNLVNNAIKFTDWGQIKVAVNFLESISDKEVMLEIIVADTGRGIAKENHTMIYEKFTRCDPSNKGIYRGTGLGLWIVKQFIDDLNGSIHLKSELGEGTTFTCRIPFKLPM